MREFLLLLSKGRTTADFDSCNAYAAGRLDIACRFITSCLCISNSIRSDTIVHIALNGPKDPPKMITIEGGKISLYLGTFLYPNKEINNRFAPILKTAMTNNIEATNTPPTITIKSWIVFNFKRKAIEIVAYPAKP